MSQNHLFHFKVANKEDYNLEVIYFKGVEELGELYRYEIDLASQGEYLDIKKMLSYEVKLIIENREKSEGVEDTYIHGVLQNFEMCGKLERGYTHYRATLVPKLWRLTLAEYQQIFLDQGIDTILETLLKEAGLSSEEYTFRLQTKIDEGGNTVSQYDKKDYVAQYKESYYDFLKRWMEREGIYFYFEQDEDISKVIITDANIRHKKIEKKLFYQSSSEDSKKHQHISSMLYRTKHTIKSTRMKNYKYESPARSGAVDDDYRKTYLFGNNLSSDDEAERLRKIYLEKEKSLADEMIGESDIVYMYPGCMYDLKGYFKTDLNKEYIIFNVESEGYQRGHPEAGLSIDGEDVTQYRNSFIMIFSENQFRMQSSTPWPHIGGMLSARIDGEQKGNETAEIDEKGRYHVVMPFDIKTPEDQGEGEDEEYQLASAPIRMAQPSGGNTSEGGITQGMHFPLHKGTEVLISFIDGDPDQPVIMGAVPNAESPSPVTDGNLEKSIIRTHGGNFLKMDDKETREIKLGISDSDAGSADNYIKIRGVKEEEEEGIEVKTKGKFEVHADGDNKWEFEGSSHELTFGNKFEMVVGAVEDIKVGGAVDITAISNLDVFLGIKVDLQLAYGWELATGGMSIYTPESQKLESIATAVGEGKQKWYGQVTEAYGNKVTDMVKSVVITEKTTSVNVQENRVADIRSYLMQKYNLESEQVNMAVARAINTVTGQMNTNAMEIALNAIVEISLNAAVITSSAEIQNQGGDVVNLTAELVMLDAEAAEVQTEQEIAAEWDVIDPDELIEDDSSSEEDVLSEEDVPVEEDDG